MKTIRAALTEISISSTADVVLFLTVLSSVRAPIFVSVLWESWTKYTHTHTKPYIEHKLTYSFLESKTFQIIMLIKHNIPVLQDSSFVSAHLEDPEGVVGGQALTEQCRSLIVYVVMTEVQQLQRAVLFQCLTQWLCLDMAKTVPRQLELPESRVYLRTGQGNKRLWQETDC